MGQLGLIWARIGKSVLTFASIVIFILLAFFVGKCSRPQGRDYEGELRSLAAEAAQLKKEMVAKKLEAKQAYEKGVASQAGKVVYKTRYRLDTARNRKYRKFIKDSLSRVLLGLDQWDSSAFSWDAGNEILNLGSEVTMLRADDLADSTSIANFVKAYNKVDSAYVDCQEMGAKKDETIAIKDQQIKDKKAPWWALPLAGLAAIVGFVLGSL